MKFEDFMKMNDTSRPKIEEIIVELTNLTVVYILFTRNPQ